MVKCKIYLIERFGPRAVGRIVAVLDRSMRERPPNQGVLTPLLGDYDGVARQEHDVLFHPLTFENFLIVELQTVFPAVLRP